MCGIFGYIGSGSSVSICLEGLRRLEYRGYDSAGIAGITNGELRHWKEVGRLAVLEQAMEQVGGKGIVLTPAIAHTRWATHGKASRENAHPHLDQKNQVAVVHNGIIENHLCLRNFLESHGIQFSSDTDSEVIAQLISYFYEGCITSAVQKAVDGMRGFWSIAVIHQAHPDQIIASSKEMPLVIGSRAGEVFLSSDSTAFYEPDLDVFFLKNEELAVIQSGGVHVLDPSGSPIVKSMEKLPFERDTHSKGGFDHFMIKEIFEQPRSLQQALYNRFIEDVGMVEFEHFHLTAKDLQSIDRILILACGTSWHAGCIAALLLEDKARIPTQCEIASEYRYKNPVISDNTLVIAISQSGETLDTIAAVREVKRKGSKVLAICNAGHSTLTREADATILLRAGPEVSVCSTKAFTSQIAILSLLTVLMGRQRHLDLVSGQAYLADLKALPSLIEEVLAQNQTIARLAAKYSRYRNFFFLGRHYMYPTALEAALKFKEITYLPASGYPAGEMKHGPIALLDPHLLVIVLCGNRRTFSKMMHNLAETKARGSPILAFAFRDTPGLGSLVDDFFELPPCSDETAPILFAVATQLFAYYFAKEIGTDIDQPRNLAKSVTVE